MLGRGGGERGHGQPRLAHGDEVLRVDLEQPVHPREDEDDAAGLGHGRGGEVRPRAARDDRDAPLGGQPDDGGDLGGVPREDDRVGRAAVKRCRVGAVDIERGGVGPDVLVADEGCERLRQVRVHRAVRYGVGDARGGRVCGRPSLLLRCV